VFYGGPLRIYPVGKRVGIVRNNDASVADAEERNASANSRLAISAELN
jgi:hypothetical protein